MEADRRAQKRKFFSQEHMEVGFAKIIFCDREEGGVDCFGQYVNVNFIHPTLAKMQFFQELHLNGFRTRGMTWWVMGRAGSCVDRIPLNLTSAVRHYVIINVHLCIANVIWRSQKLGTYESWQIWKPQYLVNELVLAHVWRQHSRRTFLAVFFAYKRAPRDKMDAAVPTVWPLAEWSP